MYSFNSEGVTPTGSFSSRSDSMMLVRISPRFMLVSQELPAAQVDPEKVMGSSERPAHLVRPADLTAKRSGRPQSSASRTSEHALIRNPGVELLSQIFRQQHLWSLIPAGTGGGLSAPIPLGL